MSKKKKDEQTITAEDASNIEDVLGEMEETEADPKATDPWPGASDGVWKPICIIAMAQDVDESGNLLMSQSKVMLEQHSGTMIIRTVPV